VDAAGYRVAQAAVEKAKQKKLNLVAGFCWRYSTSRIECYKRLHDGQIGDITSIVATYYAGPVKPMPPAAGRPAGMGDVEWQVRNWYNFSWLSGDSIVEQAVHSLDKICWAMKDQPPVSVIATGGRQRPAEDGNIFDHFHCAYEWEGGTICHLTNRQITGCHNEVIDNILGTKGRLVIGKGSAPFIEGEKRWRWRGEEKNMYDLEHQALFNAIRKGEVVNDGDRMMSSTLIAIMGREAAYTGQKLAWKDDSAPAAGGKGEPASQRVALAMMSSKQDLAPDNLKFGDKFNPGPLPQPGITKFA
jgi:predicted dehydrogenase